MCENGHMEVIQVLGSAVFYIWAYFVKRGIALIYCDVFE
jgi:hypothetical protein